MLSLAALAPLRRRDFRLFWSGQWISQVGDNIFLVAQSWLVWQVTGSGAAMATVVLCSQLPSVAMILVGGAVVDRLPRRWVSVFSDLVRSLLLLVAAGLYYTELLQVWHMYMLAGAFGLVSAFARPAFQALVQTMLSPEERTAGNALTSGGATVAGIAGPTLGGLVVGLGGAGLAFALNGLSFLLAAAALLAAGPAAEPNGAAGRQGGLRLTGLIRDLGEAFRILSARPGLLGTILMMAVVNVTGMAPVVLLRPWVAEAAGGGARTLSIGYSCLAAGWFLSLTVLGSLKVTRYQMPLAFSGIVTAGLAMVGLAHVRAPWQMWVLELLLGAAIMVYGVIWQGFLQERVPADAMGRVAAIDEFGRLVLYPAGIALLGGLTARIDPYWIMLAGGLLTAGIASVAMLGITLRQTAPVHAT